MKTVLKYYALAICLVVFSGSVAGQKALTRADQKAVSDFHKRVAAYSRVRSRVVRKLRALPAKATSEQIEVHKTALQKGIQSARRYARHGDVLTPRAAAAVRTIISSAYVGDDRRRLRETVFEAENKDVAVRVNAAYPEASEILEMPPALLLALPKLPKELRWRFVAKNLLLMDNDTLLIVDYMTDALP